MYDQRKLNGLNVTVPYKKTVIPYVDVLSGHALRTQSVNTISFHNGNLIGHNTDIEGFEISIKKLNYELFIIFIFYTNGCKDENPYSLKVLKCYLIITFIASTFIFIQYYTGPIDIFSEQFSTRAGLPRYSTLSGSTNVFSISVAFSILISTFCFPKIDFIRTNLQLFLYYGTGNPKAYYKQLQSYGFKLYDEILDYSNDPKDEILKFCNTPLDQIAVDVEKVN